MEEMQHDRDKERRRALLEELKGLFGPAFGPALEAYGRSFAERVSQDASFRAEVADRFERGRALGGFPELEGVIGSMDPCERDGFFREGWTEMVLPPSVDAEEPWDLPPWNGDVQGYREDLYGGMSYAATDLRQHFCEWIEELLRVGYYGTHEVGDLPLKKQAGQLSGAARPLPIYGESYPVCLEGSHQTLWINLEGPRTHLGYRQPTITDQPLGTDSAIFCAVTCLEGHQMDTSLLREVLPNLLPGLGEHFRETWTRAMAEHPREFRKKLQKLGSPAALDYVLLLLRHHRSGFDDLPREDRIGLIANVCSHINSLLDTTSKALNYVEYGTPAKGVPSSRTAGRDVEAAVLRDVVGLTHREIGERLGIPPPKDISYKGDHPTARKTVGRGRKLLEAALGEEGWLLHAEAMKADVARWQSTNDIHREAEVVAESSDLTYEAALEQVKEEQRRRSDRPA